MQQGRPPRNCREAFTVEGDQVYPNRYYTPDFSMAKYLGGDLETEIRQVPILLIWTLITFILVWLLWCVLIKYLAPIHISSKYLLILFNQEVPD